jgi:repressor LexA
VRELSAKQRRVLELISGHVTAHGYPPTIRELAMALGVRSTNTIAGHLLALEKKGFIRRPTPRTSRGMQVIA